MLLEQCTRISFVYSTSLYVCYNQLVHKNFKGISMRGKCSTWGISSIPFVWRKENNWTLWLGSWLLMTVSHWSTKQSIFLANLWVSKAISAETCLKDSSLKEYNSLPSWWKEPLWKSPTNSFYRKSNDFYHVRHQVNNCIPKERLS